MRANKIIFIMMVLSALAFLLSAARQSAAAQDPGDAIGQTPPRLSFVDGEVSFWRPGTEDWVDAQINTPLAPGDQLLAGPDGNLELQVGTRAFIRGGAGTQITLDRREPDFLQFKVEAGAVALDMRQVDPGRMVVVETPQAAFHIETEGYYRLDVDGEQTQFTTRRSGRARAAIKNGDAVPIQPNESITLSGGNGDRISAHGAPSLDEWDHWNYARTDQFLEAESGKYVSNDIYGVRDLERHGTWIVTSAYGPVWRPRGVAVGWVPYSTGAWISDPYFGWTWVDTAPWGWAPYHYGRWVYVNSYWCWAPGPRVVRPVYAPALVAFYGGPGVQVGVGIGGSAVGWVALGWGEPLVPWWGHPGFIHEPWWGGWGGPHCINGKVIHLNTVVHVSHIHHYHNMRQHHAMITVDGNHFGRRHVTVSRVHRGDVNAFHPLHQAPPSGRHYGKSPSGGHHVGPSERRPMPSAGPARPHGAIPPKGHQRSPSHRVTGPSDAASGPPKSAPGREKEHPRPMERAPKGPPPHRLHQPAPPRHAAPTSLVSTRSAAARPEARTKARAPENDYSQRQHTPRFARPGNTASVDSKAVSGRQKERAGISERGAREIPSHRLRRPDASRQPAPNSSASSPIPASQPQARPQWSHSREPASRAANRPAMSERRSATDNNAAHQGFQQERRSTRMERDRGGRRGE